jgi:hypothetical protein
MVCPDGLQYMPYEIAVPCSCVPEFGRRETTGTLVCRPCVRMEGSIARVRTLLTQPIGTYILLHLGL